MRIVNSFLKILIAITIVLLIISFVRILVTGDTSFYISFNYFLEAVTDVDFNPGNIIVAFDDAITSFTASLTNLATLHHGFWSGTTVIGKIFSVLKTLVDYVFGIGDVFASIALSLVRILTEIGRLIAVFLGFLVKLLGAGWAN